MSLSLMYLSHRPVVILFIFFVSWSFFCYYYIWLMIHLKQIISWSPHHFSLSSEYKHLFGILIFWQNKNTLVEFEVYWYFIRGDSRNQNFPRKVNSPFTSPKSKWYSLYLRLQCFWSIQNIYENLHRVILVPEFDQTTPFSHVFKFRNFNF